MSCDIGAPVLLVSFVPAPVLRERRFAYYRLRLFIQFYPKSDINAAVDRLK